MREESLDYLLVLDESHLWRVLKTLIDYYSQSRPHQRIQQQIPIPRQQPMAITGSVQRRKVLGFISDCYREPEPTVAICPA